MRIATLSSGQKALLARCRCDRNEAARNASACACLPVFRRRRAMSFASSLRLSCRAPHAVVWSVQRRGVCVCVYANATTKLRARTHAHTLSKHNCIRFQIYTTPVHRHENTHARLKLAARRVRRCAPHRRRRRRLLAQLHTAHTHTQRLAKHAAHTQQPSTHLTRYARKRVVV